MLVVDPWHWLHPDGTFPIEHPGLYRRILRVAQLIEAGGPLPVRHVRETLLLCSKRPRGKPFAGLVWVAKTPEDAIHAYCLVCRNDEAMIHNWQTTDWADGPMEPAKIDAFEPEVLN
jgi:hypothetical protein